MKIVHAAGLLIVVSALLFACNGKKTGENNGEETTIFAVETTTAVEGQIKDYLEINGDVTTKTSVDIYADTQGKLSNILVSIGNYVVENQVIAYVDPSRPGMTFASSPVKSPISGTIIAIPGQTGQTLTAGVPVARVSKTTDLLVKIFIAERYVSKISIGQNAILNFEAYPEYTFSGRISEVSPVLDPVSRTLEVHIVFDDPGQLIKAGMFAEVKLIVENKDDIVKIPAAALVKRFSEYFVFVINEDNTVSHRDVVTGIRIDNKLEIVEGLAAGEKIVVKGQTLLEEGSSVKIMQERAPLPHDDTIQ